MRGNPRLGVDALRGKQQLSHCFISLWNTACIINLSTYKCRCSILVKVKYRVLLMMPFAEDAEDGKF